MSANLIELLREAREALNCGEDGDSHWCTHCDDYVDRSGSLRARIDAALAQAEAQPAHGGGLKQFLAAANAAGITHLNAPEFAQALVDHEAKLAQAEATDSVPVNLSDIEQYRMQMAGISTAALGYWKEGDSIHPDYDTPALRDVAKLYAKYAAPAVPDAADWGAAMRNALDAARYRWLRDESWAGYSLGKGFPHVFTEDGAGNRKAMLAEAALDAAVDAAMLAAAPEMK